jgi:hypothetical protein
MNKKTDKEDMKEKKSPKEMAVEAIQGSLAGEIWEEIKDKPIEMFALPEQKVNMHCHPIPIEPSRLFLLISSSAVLPSLETALGKHYVVELMDKFVAVSRALAPFKK